MNQSQRVSWSAERRVILVFVVSALAGIVLVGGALRYSLQRAALAQSRTNLESLAGVLAAQCESDLAEARQDLEFLAKLPAFRQLPYADKIDPKINGVPEDVDAEKRQILAQLMKKAGRFSVLYVLKPNADFYLLHPFRVQAAIKKGDLADRPYYQEAVRTKNTVMSDSFMGAEGILAVVILVPILADSGEVTAYLGGVLYLSRLSGLVSKERIKPFDVGFIVDRQGLLTAHTDAQLLQEGMREHFAERHPLLVRFLTLSNNMAGAGQRSVLFDECVDPVDAKRHLTALVPLRSGWSLGLMRDRAAILAEVRPTVLKITSLAGLLLAVIGVLGVVIAHGIGRRWDSAELALRDSEERFRIAAETANDVVYEWDLKQRVRWLGKIDELLGYGPGEFPQTLAAWAAAVHPEDVPRTMAAVEAHLAGRAPYAEEYRVRRKDGVYRWWSARGAATRTPDGKPLRWIGSITDITERKQAEEQIKRSLADLERSNKELEQFAYIASHDLQEPLRMVSSYTQLLAQRYEGQLDDKARKYIHYAVDGAIRMQSLINDLLVYSRAGIRVKPLEPTDAHAVLGEAIRNLAATIAENQAIITNDDLPTVRADDSQLAQVFQNLLANAIKFHGQDLPRVHVSVQDQGREWVFAVKDNGIGIEPQHAERVFVIFQRLHTKEEYPGTGIGLAVCRRIVERHGGKIWYESAPGKGTTFFFTVPK
jgi:PAS domain S-box-containing protein